MRKELRAKHKVSVWKLNINMSSDVRLGTRYCMHFHKNQFLLKGGGLSADL